MSQDDLKREAAEAALAYVKGGVIGVGTGSTVNHFIDLLATIKHRIDGTVSSSEASTKRLKSHGIQVIEVDISELRKGWGSLHCMTAILKREPIGRLD